MLSENGVGQNIMSMLQKICWCLCNH